ncbi:MAG TPA: response regulator [Syntrophomonadaceae bacterium]|nr:response regulator [Syntrophomonadaceae bacterium]
MRVILIDDEQPAIDELCYLLEKYPDIEVAASFTNPLRALEAMGNIKPDVVFLDIDMPHMDGLELALQIQALYAGIIVVFVTAYTRFALDSFKAYPLDYLLKPIKEARLDATVEHMRKQHELVHPQNTHDNKLRINCFGKFSLTTPDAATDIKWGTRRVKELFMYLLDRCGFPATRSELIQALFGGVDDKKSANNMYVTVYKLRSLLDSLDPGRKLIKLGEDYSLEIAPGVCDYSDFMRFAQQNAAINQKNAVAAAKVLNLYTAPYLSGEDCVWAVDTTAVVEAEYERIALDLAGFHSSAGRLHEAENVLVALIQKNPFTEYGFTSLLDLYIEKADHKAYAAKFMEYAQMLKRDLDESPPEVYTKHYKVVKNK